MSFLFANNANSTLAAPLSSSATSLTVAAGTGAVFPTPIGEDIFAATLVDYATGLLREVVYVTSITSDVFTIERAQEGTTARGWLAGDLVQSLVTAGVLDSFAQSDAISATTSPVYYPDLSTGDAQALSGWWSCTGVPDNTLGNNGDYCSRSDGLGALSHIYHKESGVWVGLF